MDMTEYVFAFTTEDDIWICHERCDVFKRFAMVETLSEALAAANRHDKECPAKRRV